MLHARLRRLLKPLAHTVFHPQWLVLREKSATQRAVARWARGPVMDVGCGDRSIATVLATGTEYIGVDYPATVAQGYPGLPDVFGDAACLPFPDAMAGTVLLLDVLEHLTGPESAIGEAVRVLEPGGRLIVQVPFMYPIHDAPNDFHRWTRDGLGQLFHRHGLTIIEERSYGHPVETAAALGAMALAKSGLNALGQHRIALLLVPLIVILVPVVNVAGWLLGNALPSDGFMPLGYRLVAQKAVSGEALPDRPHKRRRNQVDGPAGQRTGAASPGCNPGVS